MDILQYYQTQGRSQVIGSGDNECALTSRVAQGRKQLYITFFLKTYTHLIAHKLDREESVKRK